MNTQTATDLPGREKSSPVRTLSDFHPVALLTVGLAGILLVLAAPGPVRAQDGCSAWTEFSNYRTAVGLLQEGEYQLARRQYESFLENCPNSSERYRARFGLAETYYLQEQFATAAELYLKSIHGEEEPRGYRQAAFEKGLDAVLQSGRYELGRDYLQKIDQSNKQHVSDRAMRRVVQILDHLGDTEKALKWARRQHEQNPRSNYWLYETAVLRARLGQYERALPMLQTLENRSSRYRLDALYLRAEIELQRGNLRVAQSAYDSLLDSRDYRPDGLYGLAWVEIKRGNYDEARAYFTKITEEYIGNTRARAGRDMARLARREGDTGATREWYLNAIRWAQEPMQSKLRIEYADYLVQQGKLAQAVPFYEQANSLKLEARKSLIEGYVSRGRYRDAEQEIRELREQGKLTGSKWQRLLALTLLEQGRPELALKQLPGVQAADDASEKKAIWRLKGRIHFELKNWERARATYREWSRQLDGFEPEYYRGLVENAAGNIGEARSIWRSIVKAPRGQPWHSRSAYQLARLALNQGRTDAFHRYESEVKPDQLSARLRTELSILRMTDALNRGQYTPEVQRQVEQAHKRAVSTGQLSKWYGRLVQSDLPPRAWESIALPVLYQHKHVQRDWAPATLRTLRESGWLELSRKVGNTLLEEGLVSDVKRAVLAEHLNTLYALGDYPGLRESFPPASSWSRWSGDRAYALALNMTRYYRDLNRPGEGLKQLAQLQKQLTEVSEGLQRDMQEWMGAFEIELGRYQQARTRLAKLSMEGLSKSGQLNLAIAEFYRGYGELSLEKIVKLHREWDKPPIELYDFGFRLMRNQGRTQQLVEWTRELQGREDLKEKLKQECARDRKNKLYPGEDKEYDCKRVSDLVLQNVQHWVNNGQTRLALRFLDDLEESADSDESLYRVHYYRGLAYFNRGKLDRALTFFEQMQTRYELSDTWSYRALRAEVEVHLRRGSWELAFASWKKLDGMNRGGEVGVRLLGEQGVRQAPGQLRELLTRMVRRYPQYLPEDEKLYWRARLHESQDDLEAAIDRYRRYLRRDFEQRNTQVRVRLGRLYDRLGRHQEAITQYTRLLEITEDPQYRVRRAVQYRKLEQWDKARADLKQALSEWPEKTARIRFELGRIEHIRGNPERALSHLDRAMGAASGRESWFPAAREAYVETALQTGHRERAQRHVDELEEGPNKLLLRAELWRQQGELERASRALSTFTRDYPGEVDNYRRRFTDIAVAVYWQTEQYRKLADLFEGTPTRPDHQLRLLLSLVELGEGKRATQLYHRMDEQVIGEASRAMGDYHYGRENWQQALGYYRDANPSMRQQFRIGRSLQKLNRPREAYETWAGILNDVPSAKPLREWGDPILQALTQVTSELRNYGEAASLLDDNWTVLDHQRDTAADLGLQWSLRSEERDLLVRFMKRVPPPDEQRFENLAKNLEERRSWRLLQQWVDRYASGLTDESEKPLSFLYYRHLLQVQTGADTGFVRRVNRDINRASKQGSPYAPRLQRLVGDYYFQRGNYEQAAIEYHKVKLLFEENPAWPLANLKLARSYEKMGNTNRARKIYRELSDESSPKQIRQEAKRWLRSQNL